MGLPQCGPTAWHSGDRCRPWAGAWEGHGARGQWRVSASSEANGSWVGVTPALETKLVRATAILGRSLSIDPEGQRQSVTSMWRRQGGSDSRGTW
jgi:hypothetical protein